MTSTSHLFTYHLSGKSEPNSEAPSPTWRLPLGSAGYGVLWYAQQVSIEER